MKDKINEELVIKLGLVFYISSFIGYMYELVLNYFYSGKIFSHGILSGPWLPIYGTGALLLLLLNRYKKKAWLVFILGFFLTGTLEYICGVMLLKLFHMRLWDYTGYFLDIQGHVCFISALCFGIGGLLVIYLLWPFIKKIYPKINKRVLKLILTLISLAFLGDIIATILK